MSLNLLNTVNQCCFCSCLNSSFAVSCETCGDALTPANVLPLTEMYQVATASHCEVCDRALLLNRTSCTFCSAMWSLTPIGTGWLPPRRVVQRASGTTHSLDWLALELWALAEGSAREDAVQGLSRDIQERVLTSVSTDGWSEEHVCPVCLEPLCRNADHGAVQVPCCRNTFHTACVQVWFRHHHTCPTCRHDLASFVPSTAESEV